MHKKCVTKGEIKFQGYKECLNNNKTIQKPQQKFRSEAHNVFNEIRLHSIALVDNDDKRIQKPDGVISYPYGAGPGRV